MTFPNSPMSSDMRPAWVETGVVANVNARHFTLDWVSQYTGKQIPDVQWMSAYIHYSNGEGFTCIPEVGALCALCFPSDDDPPFVLGFLSGPELEGADAGDLDAKVEDPGVESEEDMPASNTTQAGGSTVAATNPSDASFRAGRPLLNPGDMYWQGRNENFVVLRRGGVLQLGSTQICQRVYVPVGNIIRDFCENWELNTAAGTMSWQVKRDTSNPSGDAPSEFELIARENAQDKKATVKVMIGTPRDNKAKKKLPSGNDAFVELVIAPEKIDPKTGEVSGKGEFVIRMDKSGNSFVYQTGDRDEEIKGSHNQTISGSQTVKVTGARTVEALSEKKTLKTTHDISGVSSTEKWSGVKIIGASQLLLGGAGATEPAVAGLKLAAWLQTHVHTVPLPPPIDKAVLTKEPLTAPALPAAILSTKVKVL